MNTSNAQEQPRGSSSSHSTRAASGAQQNQSVPPQEGGTQTVDESTPVNPSPVHRDYQSMEGVRNRGSGSGDSQGRGGRKNSSLALDNEGTDGAPDDGENHQRPWYIWMANRYGSLELENKGSVARDHLALERTFLAWLRTSLAFASIGIAVTQLFRLSSTRHIEPQSQADALQLSSLMSLSSYQHTAVRTASASERLRNLGKPLGTTFIGVAILILLVGFHRYVESQYWIIRGKFPASRGSVALIAFVSAALIVAALVVILAVAPGAIET